jgi:hypothetical protein
LVPLGSRFCGSMFLLLPFTSIFLILLHTYTASRIGTLFLGFVSV